MRVATPPILPLVGPFGHAVPIQRWEDTKRRHLFEEFCRDGEVYQVVGETDTCEPETPTCWSTEITVRKIARVPGRLYEDGISVSW